MYSVLAKKNARFVDISNPNKTQRRSPPLHLSSGEVIRISPGQSVVISDEVYKFNEKLLAANPDAYQIVTMLTDTLAASIIPFSIPVVEEIKEEVKEEVALVESVPVVEEVRKSRNRKKRDEPTDDDAELEKLIKENL